ncbi:MAG: glycosyltransferase family 39 protein [Elainella sp. Prado103]|nr:glycosyltransferase family 39 protein [Elainella sp. Prado103]
MKSPLRFVLMVLIIFGTLCRFVQLDHKLYWYDETFTSLRAAGYTEAEIVVHFADTAVVSAAELQQYQHPIADRTLADTLHSLAIEDTQHPPLYYILAHVWSRWVGSSVAALRFLPALLSLFSLPAMYWLGQELWLRLGASQTSLLVWIGVALIAISPFQLSYGQESRQYSLWATLTLVMTAALLRALRLPNWRNWLLYAITVATGLYTFLFTGLICLAHGIYVFSESIWNPDGFDPPHRRSLLGCLGATLLAGLLFLPWAITLWQNLEQAQTVTDWTNYVRPSYELIRSWLQSMARGFYDRKVFWLDRGIQIAIIAIVLYAFYWLRRTAVPAVWRLVFSLTLVPFLPLMLADITVGGMRSMVPRYFIPSLLGMQLAVTYLFGTKLAAPQARPGLWRGLFCFLCSASLVANLTNLQDTTWWQKDHNQAVPEIAEWVRQTPQSILISDAETGDLLSLAQALDPDAQILIRPRCYTCTTHLPDVFDAQILSLVPPQTTLYLFHPRSTAQWRASLIHPQYDFEVISLQTEEAINKLFWRIVKK